MVTGISVGPSAGATSSTSTAFAGADKRDKAARNPPRWLGSVLVGAGLALLPWLFVIATGLPSTATASHWSTVWVGFDAVEALGLITTGLLVYRRDRRGCLALAATATLLAVDAWFDVLTAAPGADRLTALAMALCPELPLAVVCGVLAVRALPHPSDPADRFLRPAHRSTRPAHRATTGGS